MYRFKTYVAALPPESPSEQLAAEEVLATESASFVFDAFGEDPDAARLDAVQQLAERDLHVVSIVRTKIPKVVVDDGHPVPYATDKTEQHAIVAFVD